MSGGHLLCTDRSETEKSIMGKLFKEVFPGLKLSDDIDDLIRQTEIKGITMFEKEKKMVISIISTNLIFKQDIYKAESQISNSIFPDGKGRCIIDEHFNLSGQYRLKNITDVYRDSFQEEIKNESRVCYRFLKHGEWTCNDDNVLTLALEDSEIARSRSMEIRKYLEDTFKDRFDMDVKVGFAYTDEQKTTLRNANEMILKQTLRQIEELNENLKPKIKPADKTDDTGSDKQKSGSESSGRKAPA